MKLCVYMFVFVALTGSVVASVSKETAFASVVAGAVPVVIYDLQALAQKTSAIVKNRGAKSKTTKKLPNQNPQRAKRKVANSVENTNTLPAPENQMLQVSTALRSFTVTYSKQGIAINGYQLDLSLTRKPCTAHIIDRFNEEIETFTQEMIEKNLLKTEVQNQSIHNIMVQIGEKKYFVDNRSQVGQIFLLLPTEFLKMKWEEKFNCEET